MEKKIEIKDGKIVVYNDNGVYSNGETTTSIKGEYIIGADDVLQLITLLENNTQVIKRSVKFYNWGYGVDETIHLYSKDEDLQNKLQNIVDEHNNAIEKCKKSLEKYEKETDELKLLIKKHNRSLGFFGKLFSKKIDISKYE